MRPVALIALTTLLALHAANAAEPSPLSSDRPSFTAGSSVIDPGRVQVEAGFGKTYLGDTRLTTLGELLLRMGVTERTEFRLTMGSWAWFKQPPFRDQDGLTDVGVGAKHRFLRGDGAAPELSLVATLMLPTGSEGIGLQQVTPLLGAALGWSLPGPFALSANAGWTHAYSPYHDDRFASWWGSAMLSASLGARLGVFAELYGFDREELGGDGAAYTTIGATWLLSPDLQLDARTGRGFNGRDDDSVYGFGVVVRI